MMTTFTKGDQVRISARKAAYGFGADSVFDGVVIQVRAANQNNEVDDDYLVQTVVTVRYYDSLNQKDISTRFYQRRSGVWFESCGWTFEKC